jgi:hypothetical protein
MQSKKNYMLHSLLITFGIIGILGAGAYGINEIAHLKEVNKFQENQIKLIEYSNNTMAKDLINKNKIIENYQKNNIELAHEIRNLKSKLKYTQANTTNKTYTVINPKQSTKKQYTNQHTKKNTQIYTNPKQNYKTTKSQKKYQNFSNQIKFISDSTITKKADNRLDSNMPIRGRYYPPLNSKIIYNENCDRKENLYNVVDDCSMRISLTGDLIYSSKMNVKDLKKFDKNTHMIECEYSKDYGILHNCMKKLKS